MALVESAVDTRTRLSDPLMLSLSKYGRMEH